MIDNLPLWAIAALAVVAWAGYAILCAVQNSRDNDRG